MFWIMNFYASLIQLDSLFCPLPDLWTLGSSFCLAEWFLINVQDLHFCLTPFIFTQNLVTLFNS